MTQLNREGRPPAIQGSAEDEATDEGLCLDEVHHVLQNARRRYALACLRDREGTVRVGELAEEVAAREHDVSIDQLESDQRKRVYIALHQAHLPKLDEAGVVEYDADRGTVERLEAADQLYAMLDASKRLQDGERGGDWNRRYAGASVGGIFLLAAAVVGAPITEPFVAVVVVAVFAALTAARALTEQSRNP